MRLFVGNPLRESPVNRNGQGKRSAWLRLFLINVSFWVACGSCAWPGAYLLYYLEAVMLTEEERAVLVME